MGSTPWFLKFFASGQGIGRCCYQNGRVTCLGDVCEGLFDHLVPVTPLCSYGSLVYSQKCLEEKNEILQGKLSQLEERLAHLQENPPQEKGEVLGDILQVGTHRSSQ